VTHFGGALSVRVFAKELAADATVAPKLQRVKSDGDVVKVVLSDDPTQAELDAIDAVIAAHDSVAALKADKEAAIKAEVTHDPLEGYAVDVAISGLTLTVNINSIVVNDVTTVVADPTNTKFVNLCYVLTAGDALEVQAFEKTTGVYAALAAGDRIVKDLGEWTVPANGATLTEV
jgi:hypothetical protein